MLKQLSIRNYALIDDINVSFSKGFTTITGETGAGKSILLGGLSLVLGKRADLSSLRDKAKKCIIEAEFSIESYQLESFFSREDLEYEQHTIIRREIHPGGKSRAFVNDSPVTLDVLSKLGRRLVDIHSQHQTLQLTEQDYQLHLIDALAGNQAALKEYKRYLKEYSEQQQDLENLEEMQRNSLKDRDYNSFLYSELEAADLEEGMLDRLLEEQEQLSHVETIIEQLTAADQLLNNEDHGLMSLLQQLKQISNRLSDYGKRFQDLYGRLDSVSIEMDDISAELESIREGTEANPERLEEVSNKLGQLYDLLKKHGVTEVGELMEIKAELSTQLSRTENLDNEIEEARTLLKETRAALSKAAEKISNRRETVIPDLRKRLETQLKGLGMPHASFKINLISSQEFRSNGADNILFLFTANKGGEYGSLKKVASGGEMSRIMLVIKSVLARYEQLPTLMFDEIDSGVSGEISNNMADIMLDMSESMQIFAITHIPQVASKGNSHFKVFKEDKEEFTHTRMKLLSEEERIVELAEMLGGKSISDSALAHAKQLLN